MFRKTNIYPATRPTLNLAKVSTEYLFHAHHNIKFAQHTIPHSLLLSEAEATSLDKTVSEYLERRLEQSEAKSENGSRVKIREYYSLKTSIEQHDIRPIVDWAAGLDYSQDDLSVFLKYLVGCKVQECITLNDVAGALQVCLSYGNIIGTPFDDSTTHLD